MDLPQTRDVLNWCSIAFGLLAAFLWYIASVVRVKPLEPVPGDDGYAPSSITVDDRDLSGTLRRQARFNAAAALCAAMAAVLQASAELIAL